MASAKEAAKQGKKVALFDFVKPSTQGTKWGLGGTCVNVGCVPKKLMHYTSLLGASFPDAKHFGWSMGQTSHDWETMVQSVQNHVKMLNFRYRVGLKSAGVTYINGLAKFSGPNEVTYVKKGQELKATAANILIAVGGRPTIPSIPGALECAITSDDIFSMRKPPGRVLVVGASYIALECAGFLTELGYPTTVAVRSILLRGFDRQCAEKIGENMAACGTRFMYRCQPQSMEKKDTRISVVLKYDDQEETFTEEFDTVVYAVGRTADTMGLDLGAAGVTAESNGKLVCEGEATNVPSVFAVGDVLYGRPELTPVAIQAGVLLAQRLFKGSKKQMDYDMVSTTVFTPFEYGACGLSEEEAIKRYGEENVETYGTIFSSLEIEAAHRHPHKYSETGAVPMDDEEGDYPAPCMSKLVCLKNEDERVVGFHFVGPNAGEMTQGFGLALKLGAKKSDFDELVGIHPTDAESFCSLSTSKSSGVSWVAAGGCGGGTCG